MPETKWHLYASLQTTASFPVWKDALGQRYTTFWEDPWEGMEAEEEATDLPVIGDCKVCREPCWEGFLCLTTGEILCASHVVLH